MKATVLIFATILCHILADYNLQGWLADAKQKDWWKTHAPEKRYRYDWIVALITHGAMWSIIMLIPTFIIMNDRISWYWYVGMILYNTAMHALIDHGKANLKLINLIEDQWMHAIQIASTMILPVGLLLKG